MPLPENLLVSIGHGYHPAVRILHAIVRGRSESRILVFTTPDSTEEIGADLHWVYDADAPKFREALEIFRGWLREHPVEVVGIGFSTLYRDHFAAVARAVREALPSAKIVAGGVHAWHVDPEGVLDHCDYACAAEGEEFWPALLEAIGRGTEPPLRIPGLIERHGGRVISTPAGPPVDLARYPPPTVGTPEVWTLEYRRRGPPAVRHRDLNTLSGWIFVHAGRGCPFRCTFCVNSMKSWTGVRVRPLGLVLDTIEADRRAHLVSNAVYFMDEIFPLGEAWLREFVEAYPKRIGLPFVLTLYPGLLDARKMALLKSAGFREASVGLQSGSERLRREVYGRTDKNDRIVEESRIYADAKVLPYYDLIIDNPYETEEDALETLRLVRRLHRPFYLKFYTLCFFPRYPLTERALADGLIRPEDVRPSAGYLDVTTPHRVAVVDHRDVEHYLLIWNRRMRARVRAGDRRAACYLLASFYGYFFLPRPVLDGLSRAVEGGRLAPLAAFSLAVDAVLRVRKRLYDRYVARALAAAARKA